MGYIEKLNEAVNHASVSSELGERQEKLNFLVRRFLAGEINLPAFRLGLAILENDIASVTLPFPGPLGGLLRKLNVDSESADHVTYEERAHFATAKKCGADPKILIQPTIDPESSKLYLNVFCSYSIPNGVDEEEARKMIEEITKAPNDPSPDDLAKLPKK